MTFQQVLAQAQENFSHEPDMAYFIIAVPRDSSGPFEISTNIQPQYHIMFLDTVLGNMKLLAGWPTEAERRVPN